VREKVIQLIDLIFGKQEEFDAEHRFLNFVLFFAIFHFVPSYFLVKHFDMSKQAYLIISLILLYSALYYFSRFLQYFKVPALILIFSIFIALVCSWYFSGGIAGTTTCYFFSVFVTFIFILKKNARIILSSFVMVVFIVLAVLEFYFPQWVIPYPASNALFASISVGFLASAVYVIVAVYFSKYLYEKEKKNVEHIIENYRQSSFYLKEQMNAKIKLLSRRERDVFQHIIEGKTNKEISDELNVSLGTIKTHINNIYKKMDVKKRIDLMD
jgi:DNA-binding CsgD family transcriptional regulator